jgi:hypothetical protein
VKGGKLVISFPNATAGEAIISAIAIASSNNQLQPAPPPGNIISQQNLKGNSPYHFKTWLNTGDTVYYDNTATFSYLPAGLYGAAWLQPMKTLNNIDDSTPLMLTEDAEVYVAAKDFDSTQSWLAGFTKTTEYIETDEEGGSRYPLYKKLFKKGDQLVIGNLHHKIYSAVPLVFITPVSSIEPAYDLKKTVRLEAESAVLKNAIVPAEMFAGKTYALIQSVKGSVEWTITPGVADRYAFHFRYMNATGKSLQMQMKLLAADGTIMKEQILDFPATTTKWATVDSDTGSYINAGIYRVKLSAIDSDGIGLDYLEVQ